MASKAPAWLRTGEGVPLSYAIKQALPAYAPKSLALWGATAFTAALFLVQPFEWIDTTFINVPPPVVEE